MNSLLVKGPKMGTKCFAKAYDGQLYAANIGRILYDVAIREHSHGPCDTFFDINNFKILASTKGEQDLRILESLFIHKQNPTLNNMNSAYELKVVTKN